MSLLTPAGIPVLYESLEILENKLNILGYIPILNILSANAGRKVLAIAQITATVAIGFFYLFFTFGNPLAAFYGSVATTFLKHAILNLIRATIEERPLASLAVLLPIDILFGRIFPYPGM